MHFCISSQGSARYRDFKGCSRPLKSAKQAGRLNVPQLGQLDRLPALAAAYNENPKYHCSKHSPKAVLQKLSAKAGTPVVVPPEPTFAEDMRDFNVLTYKLNLDEERVAAAKAAVELAEKQASQIAALEAELAVRDARLAAQAETIMIMRGEKECNALFSEAHGEEECTGLLLLLLI